MSCFKLCLHVDQALTRGLTIFTAYDHLTYISFMKLFNEMTPSASEKIKCDISCLDFPGCLPSSVKYNQLPSAVASQNYKIHNNNSHTQSEKETD